MYCEFYQLQERPFNVTPDPKFLYLNARYREAIASLHYGITQRKGFITLIGEAGTGKTTLLKRLLDELDRNTRTVFLFNTNVSFEEILEYIFSEFDLPVHSGKKLYMLQRLNMFLLEELKNGRNVALLIDEAQDLEYSVLEDLRLLSNLETAKEKIIQIVLSGQPELGQKLSNPVLRQLRQRISVNCRLLPLSRDEVAEYIRFRLEAAGAPDAKLFTREAEDRIYHFSRGIPRLVNVVCDNALVIGYAMGKKRITADIIDEAAADLLPNESGPATAAGDESREAIEGPSQAPARPLPKRTWWQRLAMGGALAAMGVGVWTAGRALWEAYSQPASGVHQPEAVIEEGDTPVRRVPVEPAAESAPSQSEGRVMVGETAQRVGEETEERERPAIGELSRVEVPGHAGEQQAVEAKDHGSQVGEAVETAPGSGSGMATRLAMLADVPALPEEPAVNPQRVAESSQNKEIGGGSASRAADTLAAVEPRGEEQHESGYGSAKGSAGRATAAVVAELDRGEAAAGTRGTTGDQLDQVARTVGDTPQVEAVQYRELVVRPGDSLSGIARAKYGQSSYTILDLIKLANPQLRDVDWIVPGQTLRLPELREGPPVVRESPDSFALLVFTTPNGLRAQALADALRRRGFESRIHQTNLGADKKVFRVTVHGGPTRENALSTGVALQRVLREDADIARLGR